MKKAIVIALVSLAPTAASADVWNVSEGPQAKVKGVWKITQNGADIMGQATMSSQTGQVLSFTVVGQQKDGGFVLHRSNSPDNVKCTYIGKPQADGSINGAAVCNGQSSPWVVTRAK